MAIFNSFLSLRYSMWVTVRTIRLRHHCAMGSKIKVPSQRWRVGLSPTIVLRLFTLSNNQPSLIALDSFTTVTCFSHYGDGRDFYEKHIFQLKCYNALQNKYYIEPKIQCLYKRQLLCENVTKLLAVSVLWCMWFMTSLLLSMISLLEYLCHSILAVFQISPNNCTLSQYLDGILHYHLGFSLPINTWLFCHENARFPSLFPSDILRQPTSSIHWQVLKVNIYPANYQSAN